MKQLFGAIAICFLLVPNSFACEVCGCAAGSVYSGILPRFNKNFVGTRYFYRSFKTQHITSDNSKLYTKENYHTWDLYARFYPHKRVQIFASLPINHNRQYDNGALISTTGIGDIQLWANYAAIQTPDSSLNKVKHMLLLGGGLKMATGESNSYRNGTLLNPNLQLGTGSWDLLFNYMYTMRIKGWGMQADGYAKITTTNPVGFKFGNRFSQAFRGFYWYQKNKIALLTQINAQYEFAFKDKTLGETLIESGGHTLSAGAGLDLYLGRFIIGVQAQQPVYHKQAENLITPNTRLLGQFTVLF